MTPPLRVVQVVECGGPGGTGFQVAALCGQLDPALFEVHLVYAVRPGGTPEEYEALARGAFRYHHIPEMTRKISPAQDAIAWLKLYRLLRELRPDIVHTHSSKAGFLGRTAAWAAGIPRIFYSPRGYAHQQSDRSDLSRGLYKGLEAAVSWIGDIVAVSQAEAVLARELTAPQKVRVIRDAFLGTPRDRPAGRGPGIRVCACGRLSFPRHPEAFIRLAENTASACPDLTFVWIGDGELAGVVEDLRRSSPAADRISVTGWVSREEVQDLLQDADIFVHYSRWEGLPNAVLDAFAAGLPVVASDLPANRELVHPEVNGFLAQDEGSLARHVLTLAKDEGLRLRLGEAGQRLVREEFALSRMIGEYSRLYQAPGNASHTP